MRTYQRSFFIATLFWLGQEEDSMLLWIDSQSEAVMSSDRTES
jgi:hypothetical protein